jgi:hypothetical protein
MLIVNMEVLLQNTQGKFYDTTRVSDDVIMVETPG